MDVTKQLAARLEQVDERISHLSDSAQAPVADTHAHFEYKHSLLKRLREIQELAHDEQRQNEEVRKERNALKEECQKLIKQVEKLNYRIVHLQKHVLPEPQ